MCAHATQEQRDRMERERAHYALLVNTRQNLDPPSARSALPANIRQSQAQPRMCAHATQGAPDPLDLEIVHCVLMAATRQHQDQLCARYVRKGNLRSSVVQMKMCALATPGPQERMAQEHVHHVSLVNTNQ